MAKYTFKNCPADFLNSSDDMIRVDYQNEGEEPTFTLLRPGEMLPGLPDGRTRTITVEHELVVNSR